jgi:hypothetical protein
MIEDKFGDKVTDPADPQRCQSNVATGQCPYRAVEGTKSCPRHGGTKMAIRNDKKEAQMYNLVLWRQKMSELKNSPEAKSLGDEVAILRMTMEAALQKCKDTEDLFLMSSTIGDLAIKIDKVVKSCHVLEQASGQLMDKSKAIAFAGSVVEVVDRTVTLLVHDVDLREKIIDLISKGILDTLNHG